MKNLLTLFIILLINIDAYSQCQSRYQNEIFSSTNKLTINYSDVYNDNAHKMDVYTGDGDTATNRPLIIFHHGGSYYQGSKENPGSDHTLPCPIASTSTVFISLPSLTLEINVEYIFLTLS